LKGEFPDGLIDGSAEASFGNELDEGLIYAFRNAVGNSEYQQKTVLSAIIAPHLEVVDAEEEIYKINGDELNLDEWSDRYE
jgi:hypothetical protein